MIYVSYYNLRIVYHSKPGYGLVAKAAKDTTALKAPTSYRLIWDDKGSGANWDGAFWQPLCPSGYVGLGHLCSRNYNTPSQWLRTFSLAMCTIEFLVLRLHVVVVTRVCMLFCNRVFNKFFILRQLSYFCKIFHVCCFPQGVNDMRCVKSAYVTTGKWEFIWSDKGSSADQDASVYKAVTSGGKTYVSVTIPLSIVSTTY